MKNKAFVIKFLSMFWILLLVIAGCDNSAAEKQSNVAESNPLEQLDMLKKIGQLDKMDFQNELTQLNACLEKYDLNGADKHLQQADMYTVDAGDKERLSVAATSIGGTRFLVKARTCIKNESFSCAKDNIKQAKSVNGNTMLATLLKNTESSYETSHANYRARKAREERQRRAREEEEYRYAKRQPQNSFMDSVKFGINCIDRFCPTTRSCEDFCRLAAASWEANDDEDALSYLCEIIAPRDTYGCNRRNSLQSIINHYRLTRP